MFRRLLNVKKCLGRWGASRDIDKKIINSLANMDHCGESLCKNPKEYKKMIDAVLKEEQSKSENDLKA